jgi:dTDP-4-dehydrorhamnose reductase
MHESNKSKTPGGLELWAGVECTFNRVKDQYFNQLACNGHLNRIEDLETFAALGIRTLRYPVLWEQTAPDDWQKKDFSWADERLASMQALGIQPVVGLLHHGSGPRYTSLVDPDFVALFTEYAGSVAQRYPWVNHYTPVNEPLTTARFSGMYGHWYPHGKDGETFARTLLTQCKATVKAMQAIRAVNPQARLVQTEDLGKTFSTPLLAYQAALENERRWLSLDLLCGALTENRPMWKYLRSFGVSRSQLYWFLDNPCPPDIIGINHYLTSERFLDERLERYPSVTHGGNEKHTYADVEAVRVLMPGTAGPQVLIKEAWERYKRPVAITEAHLSCTREEQMRWLKQVWESAHSLKNEGVDIRAVTIWSLLGSFNWNSLVTCDNNFYEPGVFDVRSARPRPTALAAMIGSYSRGRDFYHPVLQTPGWWRRPSRLLYPPVRSRQDAVWGMVARSEDAGPEKTYIPESSPKNMFTFGLKGSAGASLQQDKINKDTTAPLLIVESAENLGLGRAFARACEARAIAYHIVAENISGNAHDGDFEKTVKELRPWAVINLAEFNQTDYAQLHPAACFRLNTYGAKMIADVCHKHNIALLGFSTDQVFDGHSRQPYLESSQVNPLNIFGRSKAEAEKQIMQAHAKALIIRTGPRICPWDEDNFLVVALRNLEEGLPVVTHAGRVFSAVYVPDLVTTALDLLLDAESGIWHLFNEGAVTFAELIGRAAQAAGLETGLLEVRPANPLDECTAPQPRYRVLGSERGILLPSLDKALEDFCRQMPKQRAPVNESFLQ